MRSRQPQVKNMTQNKDKLVSVITPLYNGERYIRETIMSVKKQTYENWEMIIVDDGSTDNGQKIVMELVAQDSRIHYYKNEKNRGVAETRNRGIQLAQGRYIAFLDSDDLWKPNKLEKQIAFMTEKNAAFCYSACEVIDAEGNMTGNVRHVPVQVDYKQLLKSNVISCLTVVLDQTQFATIAMPKIGHEDYATWLTLLQSCEKAYGIDEILASYRETGSSLSGNKITAAKWTWYIYRNHLGLSLLESIYNFISYVFQALKKRV